MADKLQYISLANDNGQIYIAEDVIATIVHNALSEVDGFAGLTTKANAEMNKTLNPKFWNKAVKVVITEKGHLMLEINAMVAYGSNLVTVAQDIQNTVSATVSSITGIQPKRVNVNIYGVIRK